MTSKNYKRWPKKNLAASLARARGSMYRCADDGNFQPPKARMRGSCTPMEKAAVAAQLRRECDVYACPGGGATSTASRAVFKRAVRKADSER